MNTKIAKKALYAAMFISMMHNPICLAGSELLTPKVTINPKDIISSKKFKVATGFVLAYLLFNWLMIRGGESAIEAREAKCNRAKYKELKSKLLKMNITRDELKALIYEFYCIADADLIGFYKKVKDRVSLKLSTKDGRKIEIDAIQKTKGSRGLGMIFQHIEGLKLTMDYFKDFAAILGFMYVLEKSIQSNDLNLAWLKVDWK